MNRTGIADALGRTFGGKRDLYKTLGYKKELGPADYRFRYARNSVAARVVEAYPKGTWRGKAELIEDSNPDPVKGSKKLLTPFEQAWKDLSTRLNIWPLFMKADILAGLGRYSVVLLGAPGALNSQLPDQVPPEKLAFLSIFSELDAKIKSYDTSLTSERYGLPLEYEITTKNPATFASSSVVVHWSRIIHIADNVLDEPTFGIPRLQRVWNLLDDLEKVTGAGAEAFWLRAHQGYQFDLDKEIELGPEEEEALDEEVDNFIDGMQRFVRTRGVKLQALGSDVAIFDRNVLSIISQISSGTAIPQRILLGSEQGQLASEQDRVNWAERVQDRRVEFADPSVVRLSVDRFIKHGILPTPKQYETRWPQVFDLSDGERAKIANTWADINQKNKMTIIKPNEFRDRLLELPALEDSEFEKLDPPKPDATGGPDVNNPAKLTNPSKSNQRQ